MLKIMIRNVDAWSANEITCHGNSLDFSFLLDERIHRYSSSFPKEIWRYPVFIILYLEGTIKQKYIYVHFTYMLSESFRNDWFGEYDEWVMPCKKILKFL